MLWTKRKESYCCDLAPQVARLERRLAILWQDKQNLEIETTLLRNGWTAEEFSYKRHVGSLWTGGKDRTTWEDAYVWKWHPPKGTKGLKQETFTLREALSMDKHLKH